MANWEEKAIEKETYLWLPMRLSCLVIGEWRFLVGAWWEWLRGTRGGVLLCFPVPLPSAYE
jgi:hypothetical protein